MAQHHLQQDVVNWPTGIVEDLKRHLFAARQVQQELKSHLVVWASMESACWDAHAAGMREFRVSEPSGKRKTVQIVAQGDSFYFINYLTQRLSIRGDSFFSCMGLRYYSNFCCTHRQPQSVLILDNRSSECQRTNLNTFLTSPPPYRAPRMYPNVPAKTHNKKK